MKKAHLYFLVFLVASSLFIANAKRLIGSGLGNNHPVGRISIVNAIESPQALPIANATVVVDILNYDENTSLLSLHGHYDYSNADGLLRDFDASSKQDVTNFTFSYEGSGTCVLVTPVSIECDENITRIIVSFDYTQTVVGTSVEVGAGINIPGGNINGDVTMTYVEPLLYYSSTLEPSTKQPGFLQWVGNADNAYGAYVTFDLCELTDGSCARTDICATDNCLVAYYNFNQDETSNNVATDFSEFGNHGDLEGVTIECDSAKFDGDNDFISIPHSDSLNLTNAFTISAWVKLDATISGYIPILTKGNTSSLATPYSITYHDLGSKIVGHARFASDTSTYSADLEVTSLNKDLWNFIVWRFDNGNLQIFNGTTMIEERNIGLSSLANNLLPLEIGRDVPGATEFFKGYMDEIRIYSGALTQEEIGNIYSPMKLPYASDDVVYWTGGPHGYNQGGVFTGTYPACQGSGIDFATINQATGNKFEVLAVASGEVIDVSCDDNRPLGCQVAIKHDFDGSVLIYSHLDSISITNPSNPFSVKQGQVIGTSGSTGTGGNNSVHLHLELRDGSDTCQVNCDNNNNLWGNPLDWGHGATIIDSYQIYGYQSIGNPDAFFNYDGSAVLGLTQKINGFPYLDQDEDSFIPRKDDVETIVSSFFECNTESETNCENNDFHNLTQFASPNAILALQNEIFDLLLVQDGPTIGRLISTNVRPAYDIFLPNISK